MGGWEQNKLCTDWLCLHQLARQAKPSQYTCEDIGHPPNGEDEKEEKALEGVRGAGHQEWFLTISRNFFGKIRLFGQWEIGPTNWWCYRNRDNNWCGRFFFLLCLVCWARVKLISNLMGLFPIVQTTYLLSWRHPSWLRI